MCKPIAYEISRLLSPDDVLECLEGGTPAGNAEHINAGAEPGRHPKVACIRIPIIGSRKFFRLKTWNLGALL
jgi:hypothetical protein